MNFQLVDLCECQGGENDYQKNQIVRYRRLVVNTLLGKVFTFNRKSRRSYRIFLGQQFSTLTRYSR